MASNNNSLNLGAPVWTPVPTDSNDPFAFTSRGSWTWPKTPAKGPRLESEFRQRRKKIRHLPDVQRAGQMVRLHRSQRPDRGADIVSSL